MKLNDVCLFVSTILHSEYITVLIGHPELKPDSDECYAGDPAVIVR